jgi:hypothetical protein
MAISPLTISQTEVMSGLCIRVQMPALFSLRLKLAAWLLGLAGSVAGCKMNVTTDNVVEELPEDEWQIKRQVGFTLVSTHATVTPDGTRWRNWQKINIPA